jgi:hypothetical protein
MDFEMKDELGLTVERLAAAAGMLQQAVERLAQRESAFAIDAEATLERIVATVGSQREIELEKKLAATEARLAAAESKLAGLNASASTASAPAAHSGRKTLPVAMVNLLAKQGVTVDSIEAGALDAALVSLSLEQRIAVKAQLMRAGLLG